MFVGQKHAHNILFHLKYLFVFMYVDPQRIYKCCPLWLRVTRNGTGEAVKRNKSEVVMPPFTVTFKEPVSKANYIQYQEFRRHNKIMNMITSCILFF